MDDNDYFRARLTLSKSPATEATKSSHKLIDAAFEEARAQVFKIVAGLDEKDHGDLLNQWIDFIQSRALVLDLPRVTLVAQEYAAKFGVADRFDYLEGDLHQVDLDDGGYNLITLGHVIHSEGRENGMKLIERCFRALAEHGMLLIGEFVPNDDRTGPPIAMLFGLNMLLHTPVGDVFTMKDYREWLKGAGSAQSKRFAHHRRCHR